MRSTPSSTRGIQRHGWRIALLAALCVAGAVSTACGADARVTSSPATPMPSATSQAQAQTALDLPGARLVLESAPYLNRMPMVKDASGKARCENLIIGATLRSIKGELPAGLAVRGVTLSVGGQQVWAGTANAADTQRNSPTELAIAARGCPNAQTRANEKVRVAVEVLHAGEARWLYHDTTLSQVF